MHDVGFIVDFLDNRFDWNMARLTTAYLEWKKKKMIEGRPFTEGDIVRLRKDVLAWEWDTSEKKTIKAGTEAEVFDVFPGRPAVEIEYPS